MDIGLTGWDEVVMHHIIDIDGGIEYVNIYPYIYSFQYEYILIKYIGNKYLKIVNDSYLYFCKRDLGKKLSYNNMLMSRIDGPANINLVKGERYWYKEGKLHRDDGPAIERPNGERYWYLNGIHIKKDNFDYIVKGLKNKLMNKLMRLGEDGELVWV